MSWFKKNNDEESTPRPRNEKLVLMIRAIAAAYLFYMAYDMIRMYVTGTEKGDLWVVVGGSVFLIGGGIFIAIVTIRDYRRYQKQQAEEYLASLEAAEAEQAEAPEESEVEVDDDAPETEPDEAAEDDVSEVEPEEEAEE